MKVEIEVPEGQAPYALSTVPIPDGWEWRGEFRLPRAGEAFARYNDVRFVGADPGAFCLPVAILHRKPQPKPGEVWEVAWDVWGRGREGRYLVTALNGSYVALKLNGTGLTASGRWAEAEDVFRSLHGAVAQRVDPPPKSIPPSDTWVPTGFEWRGEVRVPELGERYYSTLDGGSALRAYVSHTAAAPILHLAPKLGDIWLHGWRSRYLITCYANRYAALNMDGSGCTLNGWWDDIADVLPTTTPIYLDNRPTT